MWLVDPLPTGIPTGRKIGTRSTHITTTDRHSFFRCLSQGWGEELWNPQKVTVITTTTTISVLQHNRS